MVERFSVSGASGVEFPLCGPIIVRVLSAILEENSVCHGRVPARQQKCNQSEILR